MGKRRRYRPIALVSTLVATTWLLAATGCKDGKAEASKAEAGEQTLSADAAQLSAEVAAPGRADASEQLEFGVTGTELYRYAGTMDVKNRYASTVIVTRGPGIGAHQCSGVLVSPRMVLTAASCLCQPRKSPSSPGEEELLIDGSACPKRAFVTTVTYGAALDTAYPEETAQKWPHGYEGEFRPHPEFRLVVNTRGAAKSGHADLAAIVLDEAVKDVPPEALLEQGEVRANESLVMAGYAGDGTQQEVGGLYWVRYFRKNKVTRVLPPGDGRIFYEQQGPYLYNGYAGGPCFREEGGRRWIVGISSRGSDEDPSFTSVSSFREWLRSELHRAARAPLVPATNTGLKR